MDEAALASSYNISSLDPIDKVTILTLKRYPKAREILRQGWATDTFTPFDPVSKRITCECRIRGRQVRLRQGSAEGRGPARQLLR